MVEVTLSAVVLGPWLTEKSLPEYFSNPTFYAYFLNIIGDAHFYLPGLFTQNPLSVVNINLWTLRSEFYCYIFMSIMIISGIAFSRRYFSVVSLATIIFTLLWQALGKQPLTSFGLANWKLLIVSFVFGCVAYHWNDRLVISKGGALIALLVACSALMYPPAIVLAIFALVYIVIYIGMQKINLPYFLRNGDYSYEIYLFGFPIQQTVVYFLPVEYRNGLSIMVLSLPLTFLLAMISWNLIENPALGLRKKSIKALAGRRAWSPADLRFGRAESGAARKSANPASVDGDVIGRA